MQFQQVIFSQIAVCVLAFFAMGSSSFVLAERSGDKVFNTYCIACHMSGVAGAPKFGDKADWQSHIEKGMETLLANVTSGINAMPPKGLCFDCNDDEIQGAIQYIIDNSQN
ncbi:c-type cytochrome [Marinomonas colpomeniae]|uniref:Cytochrome c5 family protein n=1 Tax=Marinomonas colpomeniae TaxID=2774408 RepID=A0ABR8NZY2_9GAMM|nr:c-type cytochrome [Marinomonas colpomeniae]MBD5771175.1 cytochrome c5 family protein [Marinomonas colpomeniae]